MFLKVIILLPLEKLKFASYSLPSHPKALTSLNNKQFRGIFDIIYSWWYFMFSIFYMWCYLNHLFISNWVVTCYERSNTLIICKSVKGSLYLILEFLFFRGFILTIILFLSKLKLHMHFFSKQAGDDDKNSGYGQNRVWKYKQYFITVKTVFRFTSHWELTKQTCFCPLHFSSSAESHSKRTH